MINFIKYKFIYFLISAVLVSASLTSLVLWQLKPSIDFTGGSLIEAVFSPENYGQISPQNLSDIIATVPDTGVSNIQPQPDTNSFSIRLKEINEEKKNEIAQKLSEQFPGGSIARFETVGPVLGNELLIKTLFAIVLAALFIMFYVARQFKDRKFGIAAIVAMFHDALILIGLFSVLGHFYGVEVDTLFVTALLTTLSFSVHDTIVVFDRIRERSKNNPSADLNVVINDSVAQTLTRSLNNSLTIIFMLTALVLLGGATIKWFAMALLAGTILGTYSSPFVAVPVYRILTGRAKAGTSS